MDIVLENKSSLLEVISGLENNPKKIIVILNDDRSISGTITDGDVRRYMLTGGNMKTTASKVMNKKPIVGFFDAPKTKILDLMNRNSINVIPLVNEKKQFIKVVHLSELLSESRPFGEPSFKTAIIMAGGEGLRLRPLTERVPKPMVELGGKPLLKRQIIDLKRAGIEEIFIAVNYLSEVIEDYFGDGSEFGVRISYLKEVVKMGTGGPLSLLPSIPTDHFIVVNADIVTSLNYQELYAFHEENEADITIAATQHLIPVPFAVLENEGVLLKTIREKPTFKLSCNAGIYAVSPKTLNILPSGSFNMTDLIDILLQNKKSVAVFPLHEYWADIGTPEQLEQARKKFLKEDDD